MWSEITSILPFLFHHGFQGETKRGEYIKGLKADFMIALNKKNKESLAILT